MAPADNSTADGDANPSLGGAVHSIVSKLQSTSWSLEWLTASIAVLGTILYLSLRVVASQFYTPLGLTVDDAGLGQISMLVRAAFGVLVIVVVYGAIWLALALGIVFALLVPLDAATLAKSTLRVVLALGIAFILAAAGFGLGASLVSRGGEFETVSGATILTSSVTWLVGLAVTPTMQADPRALMAWVALCLPVLFGLGMYNLAQVAHDNAQVVLSGEAPETATADIPLVPYRAQIAYVDLGESKSTERKRCVVYLGEAERSIVVYDGGFERVRLLPGDTAVAIDPTARKCPRPVLRIRTGRL